MEEEFNIISNIINRGIRNGYMGLDSNNEADMNNGRWLTLSGYDLGSTWDIILSPTFAEILWGENFKNNLQKMVVMNSKDRIEYLKDFVKEFTIIEEPDEKSDEDEEVIQPGLMGVIQISVQDIKEHSKELYSETCESMYLKLNPIVESKSVTELSELDFIKLNSSDQIMKKNLSKYLNDIGKGSFTMCPECGYDNFTHSEPCSITSKSNDFLISGNDGC